MWVSGIRGYSSSDASANYSGIGWKGGETRIRILRPFIGISASRGPGSHRPTSDGRLGALACGWTGAGRGCVRVSTAVSRDVNLPIAVWVKRGEQPSRNLYLESNLRTGANQTRCAGRLDKIIRACAHSRATIFLGSGSPTRPPTKNPRGGGRLTHTCSPGAGLCRPSTLDALRTARSEQKVAGLIR
ncbi:hypothetical protein DFP72DRAFT_201541 [Ephemerocybe angulata]|uniref:Uncharacterized protein n=1 Tax=Ephemerocybe angulata TaxID=980116 RepID=A0A8H6IGQ3_9AGAR|nr:hypothetical protein DFP72DRAFT_201541 [Tulosesus angulatus]